MSFAEVVQQHWNDLHVLSQLHVIIAQSTLERSSAHVERDFADSSAQSHEEHGTNDNASSDSSSQYNLRLMHKILDRVLELGSEIEHLRDIHLAFLWTSRQDIVDLDRLQEWSNRIVALCDTFLVQLRKNNRQQVQQDTAIDVDIDDSNNNTSENTAHSNSAGCRVVDKCKDLNLIELNELVTIEKYRHLTLRFLAYALNTEGVAPHHRQCHEQSLECILQSIALCAKNNYRVKLYNELLKHRMDRMQTADDTDDNHNNAYEQELEQLIANGEFDIREESDIITAYHFASNLCQKMNKFEQSLELINNTIAILKSQLTQAFKDRIHEIHDIDDDDDEDEDAFEDDGSDGGDDVIIDLDDEEHGDGDDEENEQMEQAQLDMFLMDCDAATATANGNEHANDEKTTATENKNDDDGKEVVVAVVEQKCEYDYDIDIELSADIRRMLEITKNGRKWPDMNPDEKLFYFIHRELFDMIVTRGLAYSNLGEFTKAFYDSFMCTLIRPGDITAWNNRAFAWYQLGKYEHAIADCNRMLHRSPHTLKKFTKGLLYGNRGLAECKLELYHRAINDLNQCLTLSPQSRLAREALHCIWKVFTDAIYFCCQKIAVNDRCHVQVPFVIAKIISDYAVGIDFEILPQCHQSTIVYQ